MRGNHTSFETPQFRVLSDDQIRDIHLASLEVLKRTGVRIFHEEALQLLRKAGADISDGDRVRIPAHLVEWAIRTAPPKITLYSRDGNPAMYLEDRRSYYGTGPSLPSILDPYTGQRREVKKQDVVNVARICDSLPNIDFVMSMGIVSDCTLGMADRQEFEAMLLNTEKPLVGWAYETDGYDDLIALGAAVRGSLEELQRYPFFALYSEPSSPLKHSENAVGKLLKAAGANLPILYAPTTMGAASGPVTSAGCITVANAELLTGLVLSQLKREGAPFIYGGFPLPLDLKTTILPLASPEALMNNAAITEVGHHYDLPIFSFGGLSDSKVFDEQAAIEGTLASFTAGLSGANLIHDVGYIEAGLTGSMELIVAMDEVHGMIKRMMGGIRVDDETLAIDLIDEVGPGGAFLSTGHTLKHYKENWYPRLMDRRNYEDWAEQGRKTLGQRANEKVRDIIENCAPSELSGNVKEKISEVMRRAESRVLASAG